MTGKVTAEGGEAALERMWSALRRTVTRFAHGVLPSVSAVALEMEAAGLAAPEIPKIFSPHLRQIDPSLNDDLLDLYGRSEQVLANRFSFLNRSKEFSANIDWECDESPSWRAELHAFDYALDLALTYRISGEDGYARHLRYLIADWVAANPPIRGTGWRLQPLARRLRNWILAADLAREDWERDPEFLGVVGKSLALQSTYLSRLTSSPCPASPALDGALALHLAGRFFGGRRGGEFRLGGFGLLRRELDERVLADGGHIEALPSLQLHLATTVFEFLLFDAGGERATYLTERLRRVLEHLESILLPDGTLPLFGPSAGSFADALADVFALAAMQFEEPRWKSLAGGFGILPYMLLGEVGKERYERLPQIRWKVQNCLLTQSGFYRLGGVNSSAMVINGHPPSSPEGHQDFLSYELLMDGQRVVVDSGAFAPQEDSSNDLFRSAAAHNVLLVDGEGSRAAFADFKPPPIDTWDSGPGFVGLRLTDPGFGFLALRHERAWFSVDEGGWVILDRLEGPGCHRATLLLHFYPTFEIEMRGDRAVVRSRALTFTVLPLGRPEGKISVCRGDQGEYPGWYAPGVGVKYVANVLVLEWGDLDMPWVGGYVIIPGTEAVFRARATDEAAGMVHFEISGREYRLSASAG